MPNCCTPGCKCQQYMCGRPKAHNDLLDGVEIKHNI